MPTAAVSAKKLAANRANATRSTGPRTRAGKARSAKNATTHALFCQDLLHESESPELFHALRHAFLEDLNPQTALELALADRAVAAQWRLRRCLTAEARLLDLDQADLDAEVADHNAHAQRLRDRVHEHDDGYPTDDADAELARLAGHPDLDPIEPFDHPLSPGLHLARALHASATGPSKHTTTPFERLVATEQRLQGMLHRALKELRAAQAARRARAKDPDHAAEPPCPFLPATAPTPRRANARVQPDATECNHLGKLQNEPKCHPDTPPAPLDPPESETPDLESQIAPATTCQSAPNLANARHPDAPAQNEPTPASSPSVSPCLCGTFLPPPAQNELTKDKGQRTSDPLDIPLPPHEDTPSHQTRPPFPEYQPPYAS